ncbi:Uncharacterized protein TCM_006958 [Theobroma cacao]|uniref:TF-B3 domain-containing protein n=1 Tax=Theobroma cacao TaxID=3641 RepID=A0A061E782_THECC|nr:Uncharacterized protein TCM_006958 [Theobroma cacao]
MKMFSKLLTKTDVEKSLVIPTSSLDILPLGGHLFYINVIDNTGKAWTFPCFIQQTEGIESSVVFVGWLKFLCDKDVRVGDTVFLHQKSMDDDCTGTGTQLKIEVKRKIRLLGEDIWAAVE